MEFITTRSFDRDYDNLPIKIKDRVDKQLGFLLQDFHHPSLHTKKMEGKWGERGVFEARVSKDYRFTFRIEGDKYILRRVGKHDILRRP